MSSADFDGDQLHHSLRKPYVTKEWIYALIAIGTLHAITPSFGLIGDTLLTIGSTIAGITLFMLDRKALRAAGHTPPSWLWFLFLPVYAWKRDELTGRHHRVFQVSMGALIFCVVLLSYNELRVDKAGIADTACQTVTGLTKKADGLDAPGCVKVNLIEEVSPNHWNAIATMQNGTNKHLTVTYDEKVNFVNVKLAGYTGYIE